MKFIVENWFVIVAIAAVGGSIGYAIYSFVKMPSDKQLTTMQSGETCQCYGYYTNVSGVKWLYVAYKNVVGFASSKYLKK